MNTTTESKNKTMAALGRMDGRYIQATSKLKRIAAWSEKADPRTHEKVSILQSLLNSYKSSVYQQIDAYRNFSDLDRIPSILETIEKAETACEEAERLEVPRQLLIDEVKAELKERTAQLKNGQWPEDDPACHRLQERIRELEKNT